MKAGMRVPDHGRLTPWRFIVIRGEARAKLGEVIASSFKAKKPDAIEEEIEIERERLSRAPVVVAESKSSKRTQNPRVGASPVIRCCLSDNAYSRSIDGLCRAVTTE